MRITLPLSFLMFLLAGGVLRAQNSDLALLVGITGPHGQVAAGPSPFVSGSVGASGQINYAWQVLQRSVDLYVELPLVIAAESSGTVNGTAVSASTGSNIFFTPGARLKFSPQSRVSFYGALGGGLASIGTNRSTVGSSIVAVNDRVTSGALDFGGGLDFRLTRLLSLRVDGRDFVTRAGLGGSTGRHRWMVQFGIAFHF